MTIAGIQIHYRLSSESEENWEIIDLEQTDRSASIPNLDPGRYYVRVVFNDAEGVTSYSEGYYTASLEFGRFFTHNLHYDINLSLMSYTV